MDLTTDFLDNFRCYLLKETPPNEDPKLKLPQLSKLSRSSSFSHGLAANWHTKAKIKWDRDRGTSPSNKAHSGQSGASGSGGSGAAGGSGSGACAVDPSDPNVQNDSDLEKELNWDEILKSPFNFVEGTKVGTTTYFLFP